MSEWKRIQDEMPSNEEVLCYLESCNMIVAHHSEYKGATFWFDAAGEQHRVTHWRPLPERPSL